MVQNVYRTAVIQSSKHNHPAAMEQGAGAPSDRCVAILLTTYNGERFLRQQLDSIAAQRHHEWVVYASDDGSSDSTLAILQEYRCLWGEERLHLLFGPREGFAKNFMSLIRAPLIDAEYLAFCDQDDVWFPDKLARATEKLELAAEGPALFCSRTRLVDEGGRVIGLSPAFRRSPSFRNALVQSIAGANTMVFNRATRRLLSSVEPDAEVVSHDWLAYLLVAGCGGSVIYDLAPTLDYRQHGGNLVGTNAGIGSRLNRAGRMLTGTFRSWNNNNLETLRPIASMLTEQNQNVLRLFQEARACQFTRRLRMLLKSGVYHQTLLGNTGLLTAAMLGKM